MQFATYYNVQDLPYLMRFTLSAVIVVLWLMIDCLQVASYPNVSQQNSVYWCKLNCFACYAFFVFCGIFIFLLQESDQRAIRARLGVAGHLSTTPRWGNPTKCLSQWHNKYNLPAGSPQCPFNACSPHRQAGKLWIPILKSLVWPESESNLSLQLQRQMLSPLGHLSCWIVM